MHTSHLRKGFTLIELLLVIAIIAILATIVIIAINPARQLAQANNAKRRSDVNAILNAVYHNVIDNRGTLPANITVTSTEVCKTIYATSACGTLINLAQLTDNELYITAMPIDPTGETTSGTGYYVRRTTTTNPRITVSAPSAELSETISVTR